MTDFYAEMQGVAAELLSEFKQGAISYEIDGPATGPDYAPVPGATTSTPLDATSAGVSARLIDGTRIKAGDIVVTAAVFGDEPTLAGRIVIDGRVMQIVEVSAVPPAGTVLCWKIRVRA